MSDLSASEQAWFYRIEALHHLPWYPLTAAFLMPFGVGLQRLAMAPANGFRMPRESGGYEAYTPESWSWPELACALSVAIAVYYALAILLAAVPRRLSSRTTTT